LFQAQSSLGIYLALLLFSVAAFTDFLDGYLARKHKIVSNFGKIMDPLADKIIVLAALAGLTLQAPFHLPKAIFFIILIRETVITIMREIYKKKDIIVPADKLGKIKTVMQMTGIIAALYLWASQDPLIHTARTIVVYWFWIVALITLYSGINYIVPRKHNSL
jgi:CDP-diacylglycerol--glycerol-3-phosphate 3-phosphatidyltransferase